MAALRIVPHRTIVHRITPHSTIPLLSYGHLCALPLAAGALRVPPVTRGRAAEVVHGWREVGLHRPQRASAQNAALTAVGVYMTHVQVPTYVPREYG
jgi:hypothetical protein